MARTITVGELKTIIRAQTEQDTCKYISDAELTSYIDLAAAELYDILVTQYKDYFIAFAQFSTVDGTNVYNLPANCYKIRGLEQFSNNRTELVDLIPFENRNLWINVTYSNPPRSNLKYCVLGNSILLFPTPKQILPMTLWYVPEYPRLRTDDQLIAGVSGWEDYIIQDVCSRIAIKAEESPTPYENKKQKILERIETAARQRDIGNADVAIDNTGVTYTVQY